MGTIDTPRTSVPRGLEGGDIGQFLDDDGTAYLTLEDRPCGFRIAALSADSLTVEKEVCLIPRISKAVLWPNNKTAWTWLHIGERRFVRGQELISARIPTSSADCRSVRSAEKFSCYLRDRKSSGNSPD